MTVTYYAEYAAKKLNEVVLLGSHDAGIFKGNSNTRTQSEGIGAQALKGARFFDLRIGAFAAKSGNVSLRAYHDDTKVENLLSPKFSQTLNTRNAQGAFQPKLVGKVEIHKTLGGAKGGGLYDMLLEAKAFVSDGAGANEFLILKFDKSSNWPLIADACIEVLGDRIYRPAGDKGNLNDCTLEELKGSVIVLFTSEGCKSCGYDAFKRRKLGILQWKNLYDKHASEPGGYSRAFDGLQYYGKGGVSAAQKKGESNKIYLNSSKQAQLMKGNGAFETSGPDPIQGVHAGVPPDVVGVMYWTTTGPSTGGIQKRNDKMWKPVNQELLVACTGLAREMLPSNVNVEAGGSANTIKRFMPNIVMVDFVTEHQGRLVKALNTKSATEISRVING